MDGVLRRLAAFVTGIDRSDLAALVDADLEHTAVLRLARELGEQPGVRVVRREPGGVRYVLDAEGRAAVRERLAKTPGAWMDLERMLVGRMAARARAVMAAHREGPFDEVTSREGPRLRDHVRACHVALADGRGGLALELAVGVALVARGTVRASRDGWQPDVEGLLDRALRACARDQVAPLSVARALMLHGLLGVGARRRGRFLCHAARLSVLADWSSSPPVRALSAYLASRAAREWGHATPTHARSLEVAVAALEEAGESGLACEVALELARHQRRSGHARDAQLTLEQVMRTSTLSDDSGSRVAAEEQIVYVTLERGRGREAQRALLAVVRDARSGQARVRALFAHLWAGERFQDAAHEASRAAQAARRAEQPALAAYWILAGAHCLLRMSRVEAARVRAEEAMSLVEGDDESLSELRLREWVAVTAARAGDLSRAEAVLGTLRGDLTNGDAVCRLAVLNVRLARLRASLARGVVNDVRRELAEVRPEVESLEDAVASSPWLGFGEAFLFLRVAVRDLRSDMAAFRTPVREVAQRPRRTSGVREVSDRGKEGVDDDGRRMAAVPPVDMARGK